MCQNAKLNGQVPPAAVGVLLYQICGPEPRISPPPWIVIFSTWSARNSGAERQTALAPEAVLRQL